MGDVIKKTQYDQMKSWTQSIYNKTKGTTPTISDVTQDGIVLASQAQTLQDSLTTAYSSYVSVACSSHDSTVYSTNHTSQNTSYTTVLCSSDKVTVKYSNFIGDNSDDSSDNGHDGGDK